MVLPFAAQFAIKVKVVNRHYLFFLCNFLPILLSIAHTKKATENQWLFSFVYGLIIFSYENPRQTTPPLGQW
jgi:hypothetical protein